MAKTPKKAEKSGPRVLLYDLETAPLLSYVWSRWSEGVCSVEQEWYILCATYKWLGESKVHYVGQDDFPKAFKKDPCDDSHVVKKLHSLFDEADIIIAHNGDKFDRRKANTRFLQYGMSPPSPYQTVDTLKVARFNFAFSSNRLDDLGAQLGLGRKTKHPGFQMWQGCMSGEEKWWNLMRKYAKQDVALLERVYYALLPWMDKHPNLTTFDSGIGCPKCGAPREMMHSRGTRILRTGTYRRYQCTNCGGWAKSRMQLKKDDNNRVIPEIVN